MSEVHEYTSFSAFCGLGGFTLGTLGARARIFGRDMRFRSVGGIDINPEACADFEYLTGSPALCADFATLTPADLRAFVPQAPDMWQTSPPCKGYSGLLGTEKRQELKYQIMNDLALVSTELMLSTWDLPPRVYMLENVPMILSLGHDMLDRLIKMLKKAGYATHLGTHDCGEIGGGPQHRRRALLVARHEKRVMARVEKCPPMRVPGVGEWLGKLPMPEDPAAGPMHMMSRLSWLNWVRLAIIPAGGDHRDLEGELAVLREGQARREVHRRDHIAHWESPSVAVTGSGSNGPRGVADPRPFSNHRPVVGWEDPSRVVTGAVDVRQGLQSVADPRITVALQPGNPNVHDGKMVVRGWEDPAKTVTASNRVGSGLQSVADPRAGAWFNGTLGIVPWTYPSSVVTGNARPGTGPFSVADPRVTSGYDHAYAVLPWAAPSFTVHSKVHPGTGAYTVADPRVQEAAENLRCSPRAGVFGVIPWEEAAKTVIGHADVHAGAFAVADPRCPDWPVAIIDDVKKSPFLLVGGKRVKVPVVILAKDGAWHRPFTPLELANLQGIPAQVNGKPLKLTGSSVSGWIERIGNAVPVYAGLSIARQMLISLAATDFAAGLLPTGGSVWVTPFGDGIDLGMHDTPWIM